MINNLQTLCEISDNYIEYLNDRIEFSKTGFPIFQKEMFLDSEPELIVPFYNRNDKIVTCPQKTAICYFSKDVFIYRRLENVFNEIDEYKKYQGVIGLDITVTEDMDKEWQDLIMLINQLFLAILACNGIKIAMNARTGSHDTIANFSNVPKNVTWATGFLGCEKLKSELDFSFISKILQIFPSRLLIYGKHDYIAEQQLNNMGINYRVYPDFHRLTKGGDNNGR